MKDVYERLRERLDEFSTGFPATESGVEIKILKKMFEEDEAAFFLEMQNFPESPADVAKRLDRDPEETAEFMENMAKRGLLFRIRENGDVTYTVMPFVVGLYEFQIGRLDKELVDYMEQYSTEAFHKTVSALKTPSIRTVPINRELVTKWPIAPYEDAIQAIEAQTNIVVIPCICRTGGRLKETGCEKPVHNCMTFGTHANYFVENGVGRRVTIEEAKAILKQSEEAGLVIQPTNSKISGGMCSCCGDCCGILKSLKLQPKPAEAACSNYYAEVDEEACSACETCLDRCQMEAIEIVDDTAVIDLDRCIGCGLCVSTCPDEALSLIKKPEDQLYEPPETFADVFVQHAVERGKI